MKWLAGARQLRRFTIENKPKYCRNTRLIELKRTSSCVKNNNSSGTFLPFQAQCNSDLLHISSKRYAKSEKKEESTKKRIDWSLDYVCSGTSDLQKEGDHFIMLLKLMFILNVPIFPRQNEISVEGSGCFPAPLPLSFNNIISFLLSLRYCYFNNYYRLLCIHSHTYTSIYFSTLLFFLVYKIGNISHLMWSEL